MWSAIGVFIFGLVWFILGGLMILVDRDQNTGIDHFIGVWFLSIGGAIWFFLAMVIISHFANKPDFQQSMES